MGNACQNPLIAGADSEEIIHKDSISPESYEDVVRGRQNKEDVKHEPLGQDSDDEKPGSALVKAEVLEGTEGAEPIVANSTQGAEVAASDAATAASSSAPEVPEQANLLSLETAPATEAWADFGNAPPVAAQPQPTEALIEWSDFSGAAADPGSPKQVAAVSSTAVPAVDTNAAAEVEDLLLASPAKKESAPQVEAQPMQDLLLPDSPLAAAPFVASAAAEAVDVAPVAAIDLSTTLEAATDVAAAAPAVVAEPVATSTQAAETEATEAPEVEARNPVEEAKTPKAVVTEATGEDGPKSPTQYFFIGDRQESLEAQPLSTEMRMSIDAVGEPVAVRTEVANAADMSVEKEPLAGGENRYAAFDEIASSGAAGIGWTAGASAQAPKEEKKVEVVSAPPQLPATEPAIQLETHDARPAASPLEANKAPLVDVQELAKKIAETEAISRSLPPNVITPASALASGLPAQAPVLHAQGLERLVLPAGGLNTMAAEQMISAMTPEQLMQMHGAVVEAFRMQTLQSRQMQTAPNEGENPLQEDADDANGGLCKPEFGDLLPAFLEKNTISGLDSDGLKIPAA